jgi:hypothetical protein
MIGLLVAAAGLLALFISPVFACCSLAPAEFSKTKGFMGEATMNGRPVHLLGYQNTAQNLAKGPNAMFLPIPAMRGTMTQKNVLDTSSIPHFLEDMEHAIPPDLSNRSVPLGSMFGPRNAAPVVFDHDIYTIVLAPNAKSIQGALAKVPAAKRPALKPEIFAAYDKWYPGWTFALCCFNNAESRDAKPMLWWYEPMFKDKLFFPALDAHTGKPPIINEPVDVDHVVLVGSTRRPLGQWPVKYTSLGTPELAQILPKAIYGEKFNYQMLNGDFWYDMNEGGKIRRTSPPGAPSLLPS